MFGNYPALFPGAVDDGFFNVLDSDGGFVDAEYAGGFTRRWADAAGELGEIIGGVQDATGFLPTAVKDKIVPVGNDVGDGATGVAEGDAAIHAACALEFDFLL